jgi:putative two-component system response regulator
LVAIADVFDALTHARPYKAAWSIEEAVAEIRRQSGRQFDPLLVEKFCAHVQDLQDIDEEVEGKSDGGPNSLS